MRQLSSPKDRSSSTPRVEEDPFRPVSAFRTAPPGRYGSPHQHHEGATASVSAPDTSSVPEEGIVVSLGRSCAMLEYLTNLNGILAGSLTVIFRIAA